MAYRRVSFFVSREVREFACERDCPRVVDPLCSIGPWPVARASPRPRGRGLCRSELEGGHHFGQPRRLIFEALRRCCRLLNERGVLLCGLVEPRHGPIDFSDAVALLTRCRADLTNDLCHTLHLVHQFTHRVAGALHES